MRLMMDGGASIEDIIVVARAMERGDDYRALAGLIDTMRQTRASPSMIAEVTMALARDILSREIPLISDEHTSKRDSNRSRRGMDNIAWRELRQQIFQRDEFLCQYCGSPEDLTCDHVVPLLRGGTNDTGNLTTACRSCNSSKGSKLISEWRPQWA